MVGEAGTPVHRLAGARVQLRERRWRWTCATSGSFGCGRSESTVNTRQPFSLQFSVAFAEIPLVWQHQNWSRYWLRQHSTLCEGDTCWKELAYVFTKAETGDEVIHATVWALLMISLSTLIIYITSPYW